MDIQTRISPSRVIAVAALAVAGMAQAQTPAPGFVESPCPAPDLAAEARRASIDELVLAPTPAEEFQRAIAAAAASGPNPDESAIAAAMARDWPNLCRYKADNAALSDSRPIAVFMGDSITDGWVGGDPVLFADTNVGRGIGGQTSPQMLVRFWPDVVALRPHVVHIMAGTNDIAGNTGPATLQDFKNNILAMIALARTNDIAVVVAAIPPSRQLYWRDNLDPRPLIRTLNAWLRNTARELGVEFVDYASVLADNEGGLRGDLSNDGVHPNRTGYARMRPLAERAIAAALSQGGGSPTVAIDPDGTVQMPAQGVPVSSFLSAEGQAYLTGHLLALQQPQSEVDGVPSLLVPYLARQRELFPVEREDTQIGGVHAYVYTPQAGVSRENRNRVLIELHGGGFSGCWPACAELESMPIAALGRIKVVSLDYRQGPDYQHPAASEDVAEAYRELLETYRPENIGIYGCSAGGMLTAMSAAWFQAHELPRPGAIGVLCAGAAAGGALFGGDANYTTMPLGEGRLMPPPAANALRAASFSYFNGTDPTDPLVNPASSSAVLADFPPTLIVSGTRSFDLSNAVYTHAQLVRHGADARLHVWEGMFHGFFYNPDVPESQECFDVIVDFFATQLGRR